MKRNDDFAERHEHLASLTDEQLEARFWELANKLVDPLLEMGYEYTSPAVEHPRPASLAKLSTLWAESV